MFAAGISAAVSSAVYIENVFSTYLYAGSSSGQTINNGIDLSTKGGLVWFKCRNQAYDNVLIDTARGASNNLVSNSTAAQYSVGGGGYISFATTGFSLNGGGNIINNAGDNEASWTFRKQPKFFDVVTYTGDGVDNRQIAHSLASKPGFIIVKSTSNSNGWACWHRGDGTNEYVLRLNSNGAGYTPAAAISGFPVSATSTTFTVRNGVNGWDGVNYSANDSGQTYVAYLFAHNAGGFGSDGTQNVISCGSYTGNGTSQTISLGYEPQWLMIKKASSAGTSWVIVDVMRGFSYTDDFTLLANSANAEGNYGSQTISPTATGFYLATSLNNDSGATFIYIAIRRGPMQTPTTGTSVFSPVTRAGTGGTTTITTPGFAGDALFSSRTRNTSGSYVYGTVDKLRGLVGLQMSATDAESAFGTNADFISWSNIGYTLGVNSGSNLNTNTPATNYIDWVMQRAPGFFDVVCYTGTGANTTQSHNLGVAPELMIMKQRNTADSWMVYPGPLGTNKYLQLNSTAAVGTLATMWNGAPTATYFNLGTRPETNGSGVTFVAYLFATLAGVSKVGSYTGTGASQTINCGFTGGARFVLIKRTDSTGDWYVWDTARGMVSGTDPYLLLDTTAAEVNANYVFTSSTGFTIQSGAPAAINASGGTFVYLAVA